MIWVHNLDWQGRLHIWFSGLDPSGYRHSQQHFGDADEEDALLAALMTEEEKYRDCTRFKFVCPMEKCGKENIVEGVFTSLAPDQASQKVSEWGGGGGL